MMQTRMLCHTAPLHVRRHVKLPGRSLFSVTVTCSLAILLSISLHAEDQLGKIKGVTTQNCPPGGIAHGTCKSLTISCPNASNFRTLVKINYPVQPPIGTIIYLVGSGGNGFYDSWFGRNGATVVSSMLGAGYTAVQVNFEGSTLGWVDGKLLYKGVRADACRPATIADWVSRTINVPGNAYCGTGNSGGAGALSYSMAHFNGPTIFDFIELTSGPVFSDLLQGCLGGPNVVNACSFSDPVEYARGQAIEFIDSNYGGSHCSGRDSHYATRFADDSIDSSDADLYYRNTDVNVLVGQRDTSPAATAQATLFYEAVKAAGTKITTSCVPLAPHNIPSTAAGAAQIISDLTNRCHTQAPAERVR